MIVSIIEFSIRYRRCVWMAAVLLAVAGSYAAVRTPIDAIPDLSETQLLVFASWPGHAPAAVDRHVSRPISAALNGLENVRTVRASSEFGYSLFHLIFNDGTDLSAARSAVVERMSNRDIQLPPGVTPHVAPDAPATGQIFWYTVEGTDHDLGQLRRIHDTLIKPQLSHVSGVAEVAAVGGYTSELLIEIDPERLSLLGLSLESICKSLQESIKPPSTAVIQGSTAEYFVRVSEFGSELASDDTTLTKSVMDINSIVVQAAADQSLTIADIARVSLAPGTRRGLLEKDGSEVVGGVVMMSTGANPLEVTQRIKEKMIALRTSLPAGVRLIPAYDRTALIRGAIGTVSGTLVEAMVTATLCVVLVLIHFRASLVISLTLPLTVLGSFLWMAILRRLEIIDIQTNIMSLAGLSISIGVLVDSSIVMTENVMHRLHERFGERNVEGDENEIVPTVIFACQQVGRPLFASVIIMLISFLPVFALEGMEGKMFRPLAVTKSLALLSAAILAITLVPALCATLIRGRIRAERDSWLVRSLMDVYRPTLAFFLDNPAGLIWITALILMLGLGPLRWPVVSLGALVVGMLMVLMTARRWWSRIALLSTLVMTSLFASRQLPPFESEFVSPLDEGTVMDMPITVPRASVAQSADDLKARDMLLCRFPEVAMVMGKAGRAETAADPAPIDMIETMVEFRPLDEWPSRHVELATVDRWVRAAWAQLADQKLLTSVDLQRRAEIVHAAATDSHRILDLTLREMSYQRQRDILRRMQRELPLSASRRLLESIAAQSPVSQQEREARSVRIATDVSAGLRRVLAESFSEVSADELYRDLILELLRNNWLDSSSQVRLTSSELYQVLAKTRRRLVQSHVADLNRDLANRARNALARVVLEQILTRVSSVADAKLMAEIGQLRALRSAPPSVAKSGHHGTVTYDAPQIDPLPTLDALHATLTDKLGSGLSLRKKLRAELVGFDRELDRAVQMPGWTNVWTMPIQNRVDMLATGVNTTIGVRVLGMKLDDVVSVSQAIAECVRQMDGAIDVVADPVRGKGYLDIRLDHEQARRLRIPVADINRTIEATLGGSSVGTVLIDQQYVPISVAIKTGARSDLEMLRSIPVVTSTPIGNGDRNLPHRERTELGQVAELSITEGPASIKSENGWLRNYVRFNVRGREVLSFVEAARLRIAAQVELPPGVFLEWTGQFEHQQRARHTLWLVCPVVLGLILAILYATFRDYSDSLLILPAVVGAVAGGLIAQVLLGERLSVTVAIGYLACFGMAASTGIIMLVYLREATERSGGLANMSLADLRNAVLDGATQRLRPKLLTEATTIFGLAPMIWATGVGAEVIRPMAAPVLGGILIADEVIDLLLPVMFYWSRRRRWAKLHLQPTSTNTVESESHSN